MTDDNDEMISIPAPLGVCDACFRDRRNTFLHAQTKKVMVTHCEHHKTGGFLHLGERMQWTLYTPIERDTFFAQVNAAAADGERLARAIARDRERAH